MLTPLVLAAAVLGPFQEPAPRPDSTADSLSVARLRDLEVTVGRSRSLISTLPAAAAVVGRDRIRRAQPTIGLDEALSTVPGVHVANRWNYSLDQRLSIRGFGSRANFGMRGVKVLLDGVPQTLPDGQSQLTNVDFGTLDRIEVLRGAASALYGNASGGVLALFTEPPPDATGSRVSGRAVAGSFGTTKWLAQAASRRGRLAGALALSRLDTDGFRAHSAAEQRQAAASVSLGLSSGTTITGRWLLGDAPQAQNPGALTAAEVEQDPSQAAPANVARGADKAVRQHQGSVRVSHRAAAGWELETTGFALWRDLKNPLATPPPGPPTANAGTFNRIDRVAGGLRSQALVPLATRSGGRIAPVRLTFGVDIQRLDDDRINQPSVAGVPRDSILADQRELTTEIGPFAQVQWDLTDRVLLRGGLRYDRVTFDVQDRHLTDGADNSGKRTMAELSGNLGLSVELAERWHAYTAIATAFETPTSTELVTTATGAVGFNQDLGPQRATGVELGLRSSGESWAFTLAAFANRVRDGIVQAREQAGRAFFANASRMRNDGLELGANLVPLPWASLSLAWTWANYRFSEYRFQNGAAVDTLDGHRVAGVPRHFVRAGLRLEPRPGLTIMVDQLASSSLYADDANTVKVDDWGAGVTNLRAALDLSTGRTRWTPFLALMNVFDRTYVGAVTINGFGGRVLEPAARRHLFAGLEVKWTED